MIVLFAILFFGCSAWVGWIILVTLWAVLTGKQKINTTEPYTSWHLTHEPHKIK